MEQFCIYLLENYIDSDSNFPPTAWSECSASLLRTIDACDLFHAHFNASLYSAHQKKKKNSFLIYIAVPNTHNLSKTITDKQNKYQGLTNEICAMWKQNAAQVIPIVISSTGVIPNSLSQSLKRFGLHPNTYEGCFFSTSDRASKEVRNTREPDLRVA